MPRIARMLYASDLCGPPRLSVFVLHPDYDTKEMLIIHGGTAGHTNLSRKPYPNAVSECRIRMPDRNAGSNAGSE
ncbi:hypothetical protein PAAG_08309 [Paracoccidioides lutzii Pb01]|uniref:Uncharacterized protein n=1 Tax=Paracoccidioides lutzii (strain ATCC MYA-826 / Pb01) TaxID=502779 RepID=C1HC18_PARBA|nr:hypothetical protein PAAG_08309 [Paracoccidioides lutzii Pb01]EEH38582.1 hypothetical protein PAAG_08309 [Paracoccidioides lutzii Pb01]